MILLCVLITYNVGSISAEIITTDSGNMSNIANSSEGIACSHYDELLPYDHRDDLEKQCIISFTPSSRQYFTYKVMKFKYKLVYFHLQFLNLSSKEAIHYTRCVIQPTNWIWTFRGVEGNYGGRQYLTWPPNYGTLSMSMLKAQTSAPLRVNLTVKGKCDVVIGSVNTTMRLAMAFRKFTNDLADTLDEYNYSYWCYKERLFVQNHFLYKLCLHVICPIETIGYRCCKQEYDVNVHKFRIHCPGHFYTFDGVWWVCPFVIGTLLYLYVMLIIFSLLSTIYRHLPNLPDFKKYSRISTQDNNGSHKNTVFIHHNTVTLFSILTMPLVKCCRLYPVLTSRTFRIITVLSSLVVTFIKVYVHLLQDKDYIIESVKQGAPMNFLSLIAGYELSKNNFLVFLGGPYIALGIYLVGFLVLICPPVYFSEFIGTGLPEKSTSPISILTIDLTNREFFGSRQIISSRNNGYRKIQKTMLANIFSLLNPAFWKYSIMLQCSRFKQVCWTETGNPNLVVALLIIVPYIVLCIMELVCVVINFGFPTIFTICLLYRAYTRNVYDWLHGKGRVGCVAMTIVLPCCLFVLTFTIYMFSVIFLDSFIFLSRVAIFTYTGLFANPSYTEGYLIFSITVSMYLYDSVHSVNSTYEQLFSQTKKVCKRVTRRFGEQLKSDIFQKDIEGGGISQELYIYIVNSYKPRRVEILKALVKITTIFLCLYISIGILTRFDGFQQLSVVTQTASTTFICLVPKIFARMCSLNKRRQELVMRSRIRFHLGNFLHFKGVYLNNSTACSHESGDNVDDAQSGVSYRFIL